MGYVEVGSKPVCLIVLIGIEVALTPFSFTTFGNK